jgi:hypothetical protein
MGSAASARRTWVIAATLLSSVWFAVACGGRSVMTEGAGGTGDANAGATAPGGSAAQGGATAQGGGASGCGPVACPNLSCADGMLLPIAGSCCPVCQPTCRQACPTATCVSGYHLGTPPGECCPTCILDPAGQACEDGQKSYARYHDLMVAKFQALACQSDADCTGAQVMNLCESDCGGIAVLRSQAMQLQSVLNAEADVDCVSCGDQVSTCNSLATGAYCAAGFCSNVFD